MDIYHYIPREIVNFILVGLFSLLVGLEQRRHHADDNREWLFGTDRTFTFTGLLGYVLYLADTSGLVPFVAGLVVLAGLLGIHYFFKIKLHAKYGATSVLLALLTYCIPIMVFTQPIWLTLTFVVTVLVITELKEDFISLSKKMSGEEFTILAKFIVLAGIILPLLPHTEISPGIKTSAYQIWLAIVVVSGISYGSYLLKKFVFPNSGLLLSGIFGGMYSSTATTIILVRKEKKENLGPQAVSAVMLAVATMYLRVLAVSLFFNTAIAMRLLAPLLVMAAVALLLAKFAGEIKLSALQKEVNTGASPATPSAEKNPLEFRTAMVFGLLFVFFALLTNYLLEYYGTAGITNIAFIVGITDVDPFIINVLEQKDGIAANTVILAIINATNSNNLLKMIYALFISSPTIRKRLAIAFGSLLLAGGIAAGVFYLGIF